MINLNKHAFHTSGTFFFIAGTACFAALPVLGFLAYKEYEKIKDNPLLKLANNNERITDYINVIGGIFE